MNRLSAFCRLCARSMAPNAAATVLLAGAPGNVPLNETGW